MIDNITPSLLKKLELFSIHSRKAFLGSKQGGHISPRKGHGVEFTDYRKYELGDNPRYIDWSVYARTERLYLKQYREEEDITVIIFLDGSASMHVTDDGEKWKRAVALAASLGYVALINHDTVRLGILGGEFEGLYNGPKAFSRLLSDLKALKPLATQPSRREVGRSLSRSRFPGMTCFISDFLFPFSDIEQMLLLPRAKNFAVSLLQIAGKEDITPFPSGQIVKAEDSETNAEVELVWSGDTQERYKKAFYEHTGAISRYARSAGMQHLLVQPETPIENIVLRELPRLGILRQ